MCSDHAAVSQCRTSYTYDINIISADHVDNHRITNFRELMDQKFELKCYSTDDMFPGNRIIDSGMKGIKDSRYTLIWVTEDDVRGDAWQRFWRQSALENLISAEPRPKGCERILVILDGVGEENFREEHPEYNHTKVQCTDPGGDWIDRVGQTVHNRGVFMRNEPPQPDVSTQ